MKIKRILLISILVLMLLFVGCASDADSGETSEGDKTHISIATMEEFYFKDVVEAASKVLEDQGYEVEIKVIADNITPNIATVDGSVDYNFYEHIPFLDEFNSANEDSDLVVVGEPISAGVEGLHSTTFDTLEDIKEGALVAIPNDISNRTMHLKFLDSLGLIKLEPGLNTYTLNDIIENPYNFEFIEMDTPNIVASLEDVDLGTCSQSSIVKRGIDPESALATYVDDSLGIVLVTKQENSDTELTKTVYEAFTSPEVKEVLNEKYKGVVEPLFD